MIKSYLVSALRNLYRNKFYTIINIVGLGVAMALCIVGYVNYKFSGSFDSFHEHYDNLYLIKGSLKYNNQDFDWLLTPTPLAAEISSGVPDIIVSRVSYYSGIAKFEDKVFNEQIYFVDSAFFDMFTFPIITGSPKAFASHHGIIINDQLARKYFGSEEPLGKEITLNMDSEHDYTFQVAGVYKKPPLNSSLDLTMILPYDAVERLRGTDLTSWQEWADAAFIMVNDKLSENVILSILNSRIDIINQNNPTFETCKFKLLPFKQLASINRELSNYPFRPGIHKTAVIAPLVVALLALILACLNFINTTISYASKRLKEIGIRKVIGGVRSQLIAQFMGENFILCMLAIAVAGCLSEIFVPAYSSLWPELSLSVNYFSDSNLIIFLVLLLFTTAVAAGLYPAFYVSKFKPAVILKQKQKLGGTNTLIRVLLTFQLALSITAIIGAIIISQNAAFIKNMDYGYDREDIFCTRIKNESQYNLLNDALKENTDIINLGATKNIMRYYFVGAFAEDGPNKCMIHSYGIGENFFQTAGFKLIEGRLFDDRLASDHDAVIVNETLLKNFGWTDIANRQIKLIFQDTTRLCRVIGVVKDFYPNGIDSRIRPTVLQLSSPDEYRYLAVKCKENSNTAVASFVEKTWKRLFPDRPFLSFWFADLTADEEQTNNSIRLVFIYVSLMVLLISCMGIFALVSLNIAKRTKEIGIRKVLGATLANIGLLISKEFLYVIVISSILAGILGYFLLDIFMNSIWAYHIDIGIIPFIVSPIFVALTAFLTVTYRIIAAARANPVEALKYE
ncbi:MAG: ABC transporter permease [candidate division Zixibacteria bacterium]|nr:ABC transporter permease [candidate division Zixibacteria bacterium]